MNSLLMIFSQHFTIQDLPSDNTSKARVTRVGEGEPYNPSTILVLLKEEVPGRKAHHEGGVIRMVYPQAKKFQALLAAIMQ